MNKNIEYILDQTYGFFYFGLWDIWYKIKRFIHGTAMYVGYITRDK